ncbi:MAG: hypothetical protein LQ346_003194 [Caloplaca aetnensis]|nr:MAG: hypothetical protein LQ346_003194 [Caloplaca aetnensis]
MDNVDVTPDQKAAATEDSKYGAERMYSRQVAPWDVDSLTPTKLAAFYRLVGGDYDPLFLETPHASLSFIYQSLGCFHALQQEKTPYAPPSVPALSPQGFVRWQTVQVLLEPDEHVSFLQNAVKRFEIINPVDGTLFPNLLPREALPSRPDPEMIQWHEGVAQKLLVDAHEVANGGLPAANHAETNSSTTTSSIASSLDDHHSLMDTARYFTHPRPRPPFRPPPSIDLPRAIDAPSSSNPTVSLPWGLDRRRSSTSDIHSAAPPSWPHHDPAPTTFSTYKNPGYVRPRSVSTVSTSSVSTSSSGRTASSTSVSPELTSSHLHHRHSGPHHHNRRHSSHLPHSPRAASHPRDPPSRLTPNGYFPPQQPTRPPGSNSRGLNVRWILDGTPENANRQQRSGQTRNPAAAYRESTGRNHERSGGTRSTRSGSEGTSANPLRGVRGRTHAAEGVTWN